MSITSLICFNSSLTLAFTILSLHTEMIVLKTFLEFVAVDHYMGAVSITFIQTLDHHLVSF